MSEKTNITRIGEIVIELSDERNRNVMFPPTREVLRGQLLKSRFNSDEQNEITSRIPDLPGIRIRLDYEKKEAQIFDPLGEPNRQSELRAAEKAFIEFLGTKQTAMESRTYAGMNNTEAKTWLFWIHRLVKNKNAKIVSGTIPSIQVIESLPGKTGMSMFNSGSRGCKFFEDFEGYLDQLEKAPKQLT
jgi:hypothetical protein